MGVQAAGGIEGRCGCWGLKVGYGLFLCTLRGRGGAASNLISGMQRCVLNQKFRASLRPDPAQNPWQSQHHTSTPHNPALCTTPLAANPLNTPSTSARPAVRKSTLDSLPPSGATGATSFSAS